MRNVEVGLLGGRVPYIRGGSGSSEAIVFSGVNALFRRLDVTPRPERYARQIARLLPGYRFTILGYADSNFDGIVRDMASVIRTPPDLLMGISLGGFVAMRFAAEHPAFVRRLILLVSAHRFSASGTRMMERQMEALERGDIVTLVRENALSFRRPWFHWLIRMKLWKDGARLAAECRAPAEILRDYRGLFGADFQNNAACCRRIVSPALLIGGTADPLFDRLVMEETASLIPGAKLRLFESETHMLPMEKARAVAAAIAGFNPPP